MHPRKMSQHYHDHHHRLHTDTSFVAHHRGAIDAAHRAVLHAMRQAGADDAALAAYHNAPRPVAIDSEPPEHEHEAVVVLARLELEPGQTSEIDGRPVTHWWRVAKDRTGKLTVGDAIVTFAREPPPDLEALIAAGEGKGEAT